MNDTIKWMDCVMHQKYIFFSWLFSKLAYSFIAIELLQFKKMQISIVIAWENSQYLILKKKCKEYFLLFVYITTFNKKTLFVYKFKLQWLPQEGQRARLFIYTNKGE